MVFIVEHVPKLFIHDEYNTAIIENILKRQKTVLKQIKKETEARTKQLLILEHLLFLMIVFLIIVGLKIK